MILDTYHRDILPDILLHNLVQLVQVCKCIPQSKGHNQHYSDTHNTENSLVQKFHWGIFYCNLVLEILTYKSICHLRDHIVGSKGICTFLYIPYQIDLLGMFVHSLFLLNPQDTRILQLCGGRVHPFYTNTSVHNDDRKIHAYRPFHNVSP